MERLEDRSLPAITATMSDHLLVDLDGDARADSGETIRYEVTITNGGNEDAPGVRFTDMVDPNSTLVPASVQVSRAAEVTESEIFVSDYGGRLHRLTLDGQFVDAPVWSPHLGQLVVGPDGNLYVRNDRVFEDNMISRFDDVNSSLIRLTPSGAIPGGQSFDFRPDENLFVADAGKGKILEFDRATGVFTRDWITGLDTPVALQFGPEGDLYVAQRHYEAGKTTGSILRFAGSTGALVGTVVDNSDVGSPAFMTFGPDGDLYVTNYASDYGVARYDVRTGELVLGFASNLSNARGMLFHPNGELLVANGRSSIARYNPDTGEYLGEITSDDSSALLTGIARTPDVQVALGTLEAGEAVQITFDVVLGTSGLFTQVSGHGSVTGESFPELIRTDDPDTSAPNDPTATLADGELHAFDFGDAPTAGRFGFEGGYSTLLMQDGARHLAIPDGPYLGTIRPDVEPEGQRHPRGLGDDNSVIDDEDGVVFSHDSVLTVGELATATVTVSSSNGKARLYGWIDFDGNRTFDAEELIADGAGRFAGLEDGAIEIDFTVPNVGFTGTTFARFRVTTGILSGPGGGAVDGEVEDWPLQIVPPISATQTDHLLIDLDNDGQADPGDTIRYEVTIANYGESVAEGMHFTEMLHGSTILVPGSVQVSHPATVTGSQIFLGDDGQGYMHQLTVDGLLVGTPANGSTLRRAAVGPDGKVYFWKADGNNNGPILRFDEAASTLVPVTARLTLPRDFDFGPNGNLFVVDAAGRVVEFDRQSSAKIGEFITGIDAPVALRFGPGGDLFVARQNGQGESGNGSILRFDGSTGAYLGVVLNTGPNYPRSMEFGPEGDLYITHHAQERGVTRYNVTTGQLLASFASNLSNPQEMAFLPNGDILVASADGSLERYDRNTGEYLGEFFFARDSKLAGVARTPDVQVHLERLEAGDFVQIAFDVIVGLNDPPARISNQGLVTAESFQALVRTDDPDTPLPGDATATDVHMEETRFDYGDAPTAARFGFTGAYATLLIDDGARHRIVPGGPFLGDMAPDAELDGQPHGHALGDDRDPNGDDEDGVFISEDFTLTVGEQSTATVSVNGSNGRAQLYAWLDFDGSRTFDPDEQIADGSGRFAGLEDGPLEIHFAVPNEGFTGETFARFRITTGFLAGPGGGVVDGEVEDWQIRIVRPLTVTQTDHLVIDLDGDGQADAGDVIRYAVSIVNQGDVDAVGVRFTEMLDLNSALVPGSVQVSRSATVGESQILVSDERGRIYRLSIDGELVDVPVQANSFAEMALGADGYVYVTDTRILGPPPIWRFDPTGSSLAPFTAGGAVPGARRIDFGPSGNLFALDTPNGRVIEFDRDTGALIGDFVAGVNGPIAIRFAPNGDLLVVRGSGIGDHGILRYDGWTGEFLGVVTLAEVHTPTYIEFGRDGDLYVMNWYPTREIHRYDATTGELVLRFGSNLRDLRGMLFLPSGELLVADFDSTLARYNADTGEYLGNFFYADSNAFLAGVVRTPDIQVELGTLTPGDAVQLAFDVVIDLNGEFAHIANQGSVVASSFATLLRTDDPDTSAVGDSTVTLVKPRETAFDFGDAPTAVQSGLAGDYPTLLIHDGARHAIIAGGPFLGMKAPDAESTGQADPRALGDDRDEQDSDEDGVVISDGFTLTIGEQATATVTVNGSHGFAQLYGWIDFDGSGTFDADEQIADGTGRFAGLEDGPLAIEFAVPDEGFTGRTFTRFRVTSGGVSGPGGAAVDGEVEDWQIHVTRPLAATQTDYVLVDLDQDGQADPGDTIRYEVTITNNGDADALGVRFTEMLAANAVLVPGSIQVSRSAMVTESQILIDDERGNISWLALDGTLLSKFTSDFDFGEMIVGPDGEVYVWSVRPNETDGAILRWDRASSTLTPVTTRIPNSFHFDFGPNGNLFLVDTPAGRILECDRLTGVVLGEFITGIDGPVAIRFAPNGDLFVTKKNTALSGAAILRFDARTGAFLGTVSHTEGVGPTYMAFGPDGDLYVTDVSKSHRAARYNVATGELVFGFAPDLLGPQEMLFHPNGDVLIAADRYVARYNPDNGKYLGRFLSGPSYSQDFIGIARTPEVQVDLGTLLGRTSVQITFDVIVGTRGGTAQLSNQGVVTAANSRILLRTDDPDTPEDGDATATRVDTSPAVFDFGDAPTASQLGFASGYPTLLAHDGARHRIVADGPFLGMVPPDAESDGQIQSRALGDDTDGNRNDEDGVIVSDDYTLSVGGLATATITVNGSNGTARLYGWIDFDGSGTFDAEEQIADGVGRFADLEDGLLEINFPVPEEGFTGRTFARFRITKGVLTGPGGGAADGEVEDWQVEIVPALSATQTDHLLFDLDQDGQADPGDTVRYEVVIANHGNFDARSMRFTEMLGAHSALVPGSVNVSRSAAVRQSTIFVSADAGSTRQFGIDGNLIASAYWGYGLTQIESGPDGCVYLTNAGSGVTAAIINRIEEADGAIAPATTPVRDARGFDFGPNGNLFVADHSDGKVLEFDRHTGVFLGDFITGIHSPVAIRFAPNGDLFVVRWDRFARQGGILRYNSSTGAFLGLVTVSGLESPRLMAVGPDGDLYVANSLHQGITRYDAKTGKAILRFASLHDSYGMLFLPNGELLVTVHGSSVARYNPETGELLGQFFSSDDHYEYLTGIGRTPDVRVDLGTLEAGASVQITFDVMIGMNGGFSEIANRGSVTGDSFRTVVWTDDPGTPVPSDTTVTPVDYDWADFDFGDAPTAAQSNFPASYPTLLADNGARHRIASDGPFLGVARPDAEADGLPDPLAAGDENSGFRNDEDGVVIVGDFAVTIGEDATAMVMVNGSDGSARLYGWIDFDASGTFDADEQIADGSGQFAGLGNGKIGIRFRAPDDGFTGETFARFRVSTQAGLMSDGSAEDGEVEDHLVTIHPALASICGFVYFDADNDGVKDPGELGLPNVPVSLDGPASRVQVTAEDGSYAFLDLPHGFYRLSEAQPRAFRDGRDTPGIPITGRAVNDCFLDLELAAGFHARDFNFGEQGLVAELLSMRLFLSSTPSNEELFLQFTEWSANDAWSSFQAEQDGMIYGQLNGLTLGGKSIELYDSRWMPVAISTDGGSITAAVDRGERYTVHVVGGGMGVSLPMTNLVTYEGDKVMVRGTPADDRIEVLAGAAFGRWTARVNGLECGIEVDGSTIIEVDGAGGRDQLRLVGTEGAELAVLRPNGAIVQGDGYTVLAVHVESTEFEGGGGSDFVRLHGARRGRALMTYDDPETDWTRTELAGDGFLLAATGEQVHVARDSGFRRLSSARIVPASLDRGEGTNAVAAGAIFEEASAPAEVGRGDPAAQQWQDEWEAVLQMLWMREPEKIAAERSATNKHITSIEEIDRIFARWE